MIDEKEMDESVCEPLVSISIHIQSGRSVRACASPATPPASMISGPGLFVKQLSDASHIRMSLTKHFLAFHLSSVCLTLGSLLELQGLPPPPQLAKLMFVPFLLVLMSFQTHTTKHHSENVANSKFRKYLMLDVLNMLISPLIKMKLQHWSFSPFF